MDRSTKFAIGAGIAGIGALGLAVAAAREETMMEPLSVPEPLETEPITDPLAPFEPVTSCDDDVPKPGVVAFRDWVMQGAGGQDWGITRPCPETGPPTSRHHEGRAWDWAPPSPEVAWAVIDQLLAGDVDDQCCGLARAAGLRVIIYERRIWTAGDITWKPYDGESPHDDHVHFAFSWAGANAKTSLYAFDELLGVSLAATGSNVPAVRTSMSVGPLSKVLSAAHLELFGRRPSLARLGVIWAHVQHETGGTSSAYNYNWGNIAKSPGWDGDWHLLSVGPGEPSAYRAYPSAEAGARDLWRLLADRYSQALAAADTGNTAAYAHELKAKGYYQQSEQLYAKALDAWHNQWERHADRLQRAGKLAGLVAVCLASGVAWGVENYG